jgi:hypothetical protein
VPPHRSLMFSWVEVEPGPRGTSAARGRPPRFAALLPAGRATRSARRLRRARAAWRGRRRGPRARLVGTTGDGGPAASGPSPAPERHVGRRMSLSLFRSFSAPQRRTRRLSDSLWSWSACALDVQWDGRHARRNDVQKRRVGRPPGGRCGGENWGGYRLGGSSRWVSAVRRRPPPGVRTAWASARRDPTRTMSCLARVTPV